jgi:hypothetical protein
LYGALSIGFFDDAPGLRHYFLGYSQDSLQFVWFLNWWPYAIGHHLNPLICKYVWYPGGFNMTWATSVPTLALLTWPLTAAAGPVVSYNAINLAAPALDAWAAYLLAFELTADTPAAATGGFLFGFGAANYLEVVNGELNLAMVCLVPLAVLLCVRRVGGRIGRVGFIACLTLLLVLQLGISTEVLATLCVFGALAWVIFLAALPVQRQGLLSLAADIWISAGLAVLLASPFLVTLWRGLAEVPAQINSPIIGSADPLSYLFAGLPVRGLGPALMSLVSGFGGFRPDRAAIIGWPLLLIACLSAGRGAPSSRRALLAASCLLLVLSLGPVLHWNGALTNAPMPWRLALPLPLIRAVLPARFSMYVTLGLSLAAASWLAAPGSKRPRYALAALACIMLVPARPDIIEPPWQAQPIMTLPAKFTWTPWPEQPFFTKANIARALGDTPNVLILPFGPFGPNMAWQLNAGMAFTQSAGYVGFTPNRAAGWRVLGSLLFGPAEPDFASDFSGFCYANGVKYVLIGTAAPSSIVTAIDALHWPSRNDNGVEIVTVQR